jgi:hypothetical protein
MLYICIFSNKLDLNQAIRVSHSLFQIWSHLKQQTGPRKDLTEKKNNLSTKKNIFEFRQKICQKFVQKILMTFLRSRIVAFSALIFKSFFEKLIFETTKNIIFHLFESFFIKMVKS